MAFRGEVHDRVDTLEERPDRAAVPDVSLDEPIPPPTFGKTGGARSVRKRIQVDDGPIGPFPFEKTDEVLADEATSTGDEKVRISRLPGYS